MGATSGENIVYTVRFSGEERDRRCSFSFRFYSPIYLIESDTWTARAVAALPIASSDLSAAVSEESRKVGAASVSTSPQGNTLRSVKRCCSFLSIFLRNFRRCYSRARKKEGKKKSEKSKEKKQLFIFRLKFTVLNSLPTEKADLSIQLKQSKRRNQRSSEKSGEKWEVRGISL